MVKVHLLPSGICVKTTLKMLNHEYTGCLFADQADKLIAFNSIIIKAMYLQLVPFERPI